MATRNLRAAESKGRTEGANERARAIARALRVEARQVGVVDRIMPSSAKLETSWFGSAVWISFAVMVALPGLLGATYLWFVASDQYVSEARFALRGSESAIVDTAVSGLSSAAVVQKAQDTFIVADYIRSRAMFEALDRTIDLRRIYSWPGADFLARWNPSAAIEDLAFYWRWRTDVKVDINSGIVTMKARAFTPEDALKVADGIVKLSEQLLNDMSARARRDAVTNAAAELKRAEAALQRALSDERKTRDAERVFDATKSAEVVTTLAAELKSRFMQLQEFEAPQRTVSPDAPQMRVLQSRMKTLQDQIRALESEVASDKKTTLSGAQQQLDRAALLRKVAESQYILAATKFESARLRADSQQAYLVMFVAPHLAEDALYPRRALYTCLGLLFLLVVWGIGMAAIVVARDHMAR